MVLTPFILLFVMPRRWDRSSSPSSPGALRSRCARRPDAVFNDAMLCWTMLCRVPELMHFVDRSTTLVPGVMLHAMLRAASCGAS